VKCKVLIRGTARQVIVGIDEEFAVGIPVGSRISKAGGGCIESLQCLPLDGETQVCSKSDADRVLSCFILSILSSLCFVLDEQDE
jgi:hypothetical protein